MSKSPLPDGLRCLVLARDRHRCRWCGRSNVTSLDPHHIRYRRGASDDVAGNLITLCRLCHNFVHGARNPAGHSIAKAEAQEILWALIDMPGVTGMSLWRQKKRNSEQELERLPGGTTLPPLKKEEE